jgi:hypothetical protein
VGRSRDDIGRVEIGFDQNIFVLHRIDPQRPDGTNDAALAILGVDNHYLTDLITAHRKASTTPQHQAAASNAGVFNELPATDMGKIYKV